MSTQTHKTHKQDLLFLLKDIKVTMQQVKNAKLYMSDWYVSDEQELINEGIQEELSCGYAACVLGEHAVRKNAGSADARSIADKAAFISKKLDWLSELLFADRFLANSIYEYNTESRMHCAQLSELFTTEELKSNHLTKEYPSPADVIEWLDVCIDKVERV